MHSCQLFLGSIIFIGVLKQLNMAHKLTMRIGYLFKETTRLPRTTHGFHEQSVWEDQKPLMIEGSLYATMVNKKIMEKRMKMSELQAVEKMKQPNTRSSIAKDLRNLGLKEGMTVIVHSSLSSFGWTCGGPVTVVQALIDVIGDTGTIVMPTQSADNSEPSGWQNPPVPKEWWSIIREEMPAYDPQVTPARGMGVIVDTFRIFPGVKRSEHPMYSFAAYGKHADYIVSEQPLEAGFGEKSPLGKIYELDGHVLLLGVTHDSNTSLHLAEHALSNREKVQKGAAMLENGQRVWKTFEEIIYDSDPFEQLGQDYEKQHEYKEGRVGIALSKLMKQRDIVEFGRKWLHDRHKEKITNE